MIDYLIIAGIAAVIVFTIYRSLKAKKTGGSCCGCSGCPSADDKSCDAK